MPFIGVRSINIHQRPSKEQSALTVKKGGHTKCGFCGAKVMTSFFSALLFVPPHSGEMESIMEKKYFESVLKALILFCIGGIAYLLIEILWRGHSHWSMFFLGGACFFIVGLINEHSDYNAPLVFDMILASFIITTLEFIAGYILNIRLNLNVWDYSDLPFNIMGQVCLPYMGLWFVLSFFCIMIDDALRRYLFGEEKKVGLFKNSR